MKDCKVIMQVAHLYNKYLLSEAVVSTNGRLSWRQKGGL